jgi:hypothetical protein
MSTGRSSLFKLVAAVSFILALAGCVSTADQSPPTYQINASNEIVKSAIVSIYAQDGFSVLSDSQFQITMQRLAGGSALRHSFTITGTNPVTATGSISVVERPGSGFERPTDYTWYASARALMDGYMQRVRTAIGQ